MTDRQQDIFLEALADTPNVAAAALAAGVGRTTVYDRRALDPGFASLWDEAIERSTDMLVGECYRRAVRGVEKPVFYQGEECGRVREYSDTLAIFLLKSHRREVYGEKAPGIPAGPKPDDMPIPVTDSRYAEPDDDDRPPADAPEAGG